MQQHRNAATMLVELDDEHTKGSICVTNFSCDRNNNVQKIRQHLPVLSSSQRCDHWFCHGCVLREQLRVAEENNGRIPKWIKCMHCREKTSFNPAEPKYHRLLIDLLARAQKYAAAQLKNEEQEKSVDEQLDVGRATSFKREADAVDDDEDEDVQLNACMKNESDAFDDDEEEREVKRPKFLSPSSPLVKVKEEPIEWGDQYDPQPLLESALFTNEASRLAAATGCTNDQLDGLMSADHPGDYVDVEADEDIIKLRRTDRIRAAPITITEVSKATMSSKREEEDSFSGVAADEQKKKRRTDRITAAPITITQVSETTKKVGEEGTFISDVEDGTKKLAAKEGKGRAAKRRSPPKESALAGLKSLTKKSGADNMIRLYEEGDAKEMEEPSSATTDSSAISSSPKKDEAKSEEGKRGAKKAEPNFDPSPNKVQCNHQLEAIRVDKQGGGDSSELTEEQRRERERNIQFHITVIEQSSRCKSSTCGSSNCQKMKSCIKHVSVCTVKSSGGCKLCKRIWALLKIHAHRCKNNTCPVPQCIAIKNGIRQLQQIQ